MSQSVEEAGWVRRPDLDHTPKEALDSSFQADRAPLTDAYLTPGGVVVYAKRGEEVLMWRICNCERKRRRLPPFKGDPLRAPAQRVEAAE